MRLGMYTVVKQTKSLEEDRYFFSFSGQSQDSSKRDVIGWVREKKFNEAWTAIVPSLYDLPLLQLV